MRRILISVAAIALIAGCKGKAPEPVATDAGMVTANATPLALPSLAADPKAVPLAGSYSNAGGGTLTLNADMTYSLTGSDSSPCARVSPERQLQQDALERVGHM